MGRWRKRALSIASDSLFWAVMITMHRARRPLIHFSAFVKSRSTSPPSSKRFSETKIVQMVSHKCAEIMRELFTLLEEPLPDQCFDTDQKRSPGFMLWLSFKVVCRHASQFHRRIEKPNSCYPQKLFLLIASKAGVFCQLRKDVSSELVSIRKQLQQQEDALDLPSTSSRKKQSAEPAVHTAVKKIIFDSRFHEELKGAAESGVLNDTAGGLYNFLGFMAQYLKVEVAQNERVNKMLTMLGENCPNASLEPWTF